MKGKGEDKEEKLVSWNEMEKRQENRNKIK